MKLVKGILFLSTLYICLVILSCNIAFNINSDSKESPVISSPENLELDASFTPKAPGTSTYYIDPVNGDDENNGTSTLSALQSFDGLWPRLTGGERVYLMDGKYEDLEMREMASFPDWISFLPYPGHKPELGEMNFYISNGVEKATPGGTYSYYLDFIGLHFSDGVKLYNINNVSFRGCAFTKKGALNGSVEAILKAGVSIKSSGYITIEKCEITQVGIGISAYGEDITLKDNHIHHITHDGMQIIGIHRGLIEGNRIYNADDGVDDSSGYDWNRHNDGIHVYMRGGAVLNSSYENQDIIIRGNLIYDICGQGVQFNNYHYSENGFQNRNFLVENNIFGPTSSPAFHNSEGEPVAGLIFRHNTFIDFGEEGRTFTSLAGRNILCNNYLVDFSSQTTSLEVYNNIFATHVSIPDNAIRKDFNLLQSSRKGRTVFGHGSVFYEEPLFVNPHALDGRLRTGTPAINGGTRLGIVDGLEGQGIPIEDNLNVDFYGNPRDNRPDMGAYEEQGNNPPLETPLMPDTGPKTIFMDDFSDGNLDRDFWLEEPGVQGLSWSGTDDYEVMHSDTFNGYALSPPMGLDAETGGSILLSNQGSDWENYTFEFIGVTYLKYSDGPLLLVQDSETFYWLDIATQTGRLLRVTDGTYTELIQNNDLRISHGDVQSYKIKVSHPGTGGVRFEIWKDSTPVLDYTDTDTEADNFPSGGIGFHRRVDDENLYYHRIMVDDIKITLD